MNCMPRLLLFSFFTLFSCLTVCAQTRLLEEEFIDNRNGWAESKNEDAEYEIRDGKYRVTCGLENNKAIYLQILFPFDENKDFTIESRMEKLDGTDAGLFGLQWGRDNSSNFYFFGINGEGSFIVQKFVNGQQHKRYAVQVKTNLIEKGNGVSNRLRIEKTQDRLRFYANENLLTEIPFQEFFGHYLGFCVVNKQTVAFDNLLVSATTSSGPTGTIERKDSIVEVDVDMSIPPAAKMDENKVAIILGTERYRTIQNAPYAKRDAAIFREYANRVLGVVDDKNHLYYKTDDEVTKAEFEKLFTEDGWLSKRADENTDVYIFYAGHGAPNLKEKSPYLLPYDGDPNYPTQTGFSLNRLYELLAKANAKSITVFVDACFSGGTRDNKMLFADARPVQIVVNNPALASEKLTVFSAASGDQISCAYPEKKHGLFTYFLLKGLRGIADANNDKKITVEELEAYLRTNVSETARLLDREQTPEVMGKEKQRVLVRLGD